MSKTLIDRVTLRVPRDLNLLLDFAVLHRRKATGKRINKTDIVLEVLEKALAPYEADYADWQKALFK